MAYVFQPRVELKPRGLDGISEDQIAQHWKLYEGYVNNVNLLQKKLEYYRQRQDFGTEYSELKRHLGYEYNGMILHEHYFSVLRPGPEAPGGELDRMLTEQFGSFDSWRREFSAMGKIRGVGWVVLYLDPLHDVLTNHWITMHEDGHPAGFFPILVMDVWEHAFMVDWNVDQKADYISAFLKNVVWRKVEEHLRAVRQVEKAFA